MIGTTDDGFLGGRIVIRQPSSGYRAGIDPVLLAASVPAKQGESVLDLGTGVGTALLCLGSRVAGLDLVGVERQPELADLASGNFQRNGIAGSVHACCLTELPDDLRSRSFDHVIVNPPFFRRGAGTAAQDPSRDAGRSGDTPLSDWLDVAVRRLRPGGRLSIIQRTERIGEVFGLLEDRVGGLVLLPVASRPGRDAALFLLAGRKGSKAGTVLRAPFVLHEGDRHEADRDSYTTAARVILRDGEALSL